MKRESKFSRFMKASTQQAPDSRPTNLMRDTNVEEVSAQNPALNAASSD